MVMSPKIATCCYCGTRAALRLDRERHELTCGNCGAPLRDFKQMNVGSRDNTPKYRKSKKSKKPRVFSRFRENYEPVRKPRKRRKSLIRKMFEEAFDVIEDIID
jgi:hypothetical protein